MRTQTINKIITDNGYESYLEIGLGDGSNFLSINSTEKVGIDIDLPPLLKTNRLTSEIWGLSSNKYFLGNNRKFDLIFIDGDHTSQQVEKDIINSYKALNKGGMILLHDVNPPSEEAQIVPRQQDQWTGDVWRSVVGFKQEYGDKIKTGYFDDPYGLFAIYKTGRYAVKEGFTDYDISYQEFDKNRKELLGI